MSADGVFPIHQVAKPNRTKRAPRLRTRRSQSAATVGGIRPTTWLNLVCLDAPLVAVVWQELMGRTFGVQLRWPVRAMLFLTAWLIYLADRWFDVLALAPARPHPLRQDFWLRRRRPFGVLGMCVGSAALLIGCFAMERSMLVSGAVVAVAAVAYLVMNHACRWVWSVLPVKECWVGFVFAGGTVAGLAPSTFADRASVAPLISALALFGLLCSLNCISIAVWEREIDLGQGNVSIATVRPEIQRWLSVFAAIIIALSAMTAVTYPNLTRVAVCVGVSAILLRLIPTMPVSRDERTALADLVLLTPLMLML